jgi:hypothetical protein
MATTKAMKVWGTTAEFNSYAIGEITSVGKGKRKRQVIEVFTCDTPNEQAEKISSGIDNGSLTLGVIFDGESGGVYESLDADFQAGTVATLLLTATNGATFSVDAFIGELDNPGGNAKGGLMECDVTFELSGAITYTGA